MISGATAARYGDEGARPEIGAATVYTVTDIGTFDGELANAFGINDLGEVVGRAEHPDTAIEAFLWREGELIGLGSLVESGLGSTAFAINNNSEVVGDSPAPDPQFPGNTWVPFYWSEETGMINIGDDFTYSGTGQAHGINNDGVAVGRWRRRAFTWSVEEGYSELELLPDAFFEQGEAMAINDDGVIVGSSSDPEGFTKPVRWHPDGTIEQLPTLGGNYGVANEVNIHGEIAGEAQRGSGHTRPVLWTPDGSVAEIPMLEEVPPLDRGLAESINDDGVIVGLDGGSAPGDGRQAGWVYYPNGTKLRLNDLIDPDSGWDIRIPLDINNHGQIVGIGILTIDGVPYPGRAFLLTPVAQPAIIVSPTLLDFGDVAVGDSGGPASISLTSISATEVTVDQVVDPEAPFAATGGTCGPPPFTLAPAAGCTLDYTFSPDAEGLAEAAVTIISDAPTSPDTVTLRGNGTAPVPIIEVDPHSLTAVVDEGQVETQPLTIANLGTATLEWEVTEEADGGILRTGGRAPAGSSGSLARRAPTAHTGSSGAERSVATSSGNAETTDLASVLGETLPGVRPISPMRGVVDCYTEPGLVIHDDGTVENGYSGNPELVDQVIFADRFTPSAYPASFSAVCVAFLTQGQTSLDFEIVVFDDSGADGGPGSELGALPASASDIPGVPDEPEWFSYDISSLGLSIDSGSVYIGVRWATDSSVFVSVDESPDRPIGFAGGYWWNDNSNVWTPIESAFSGEYRSLFVRAVEGAAGPVDCTLPDWVSVDPIGGSVPGGNEQVVDVTFDASGLEPGDFSASLCLSSNDPDRPLTTVPLFLTVTEVDGPVLAFDPSGLDFGEVEVGSTSEPQSATLSNNGNAAATGLAFNPVGDGFDADTSACGDSLATGESCLVSVIFTPIVPGPSSATLEVTGDQDAAASLGLSGEGMSPGAGFTAMALEVDPDELGSDGNAVFEPGELVEVAPAWRNDGTTPQGLSGDASDLIGPDGAKYTLVLEEADYGTLDPDQTASCLETGVCYQVSVDDPAVRPTAHWEATFDETLSDDTVKTWTLHIGDSFVDVSRANLFYPSIETLLHRGITGGCTDSEYCPTAHNTRDQMPVFVLRAVEGTDYEPPACIEGAEVFHDVAAGNVFCPWIEELANRGVVSGCGGDNYCPNAPVTRGQMAIFLLRSLEGSDYEPPACTGQFVDVPCPSLFADWIEELFNREITGGCSNQPLRYCPANPVNREQMAAFIGKAFGLTLYGP